MKAIVAVDLNWGIGCGGSLLELIPGDMKFFKQMTVGKVVVMGRETFESLPGKEPLKERINIVLSKNKSYHNDKVILCRSMDDLFRELDKYSTEDVFVIGGESIYTQLLPLCTEAYVTKIKREYIADKYFINLDNDQAWEQVSKSETKSENNIRYSFIKYINTRFI